MKNNFENLEKLLRSVKPADVELPSHKANLRRMLLTKHNEKVGFVEQVATGSSFNNFFKFAILPVMFIAVVGVWAAVIINSNKTSTTTSNNGIQANDSKTDNIGKLDVTYNFIESTPAVQAGVINMLTDSLPTASGSPRGVLAYNQYAEGDLGISFTLPSFFNGSVVNNGYFSEKEYFFYYLGDYSIDGTEGDQDYMQVAVYKNVDMAKFQSYINYGFYEYTGRLIMVGGYNLQEIQASGSSDIQPTLYMFNGDNGKPSMLSIGFARRFVAAGDGGKAGDSETKATQDRALYTEIMGDILSSVKIKYTFDTLVNGEAGFEIQIPRMMNYVSTNTSDSAMTDNFSESAFTFIGAHSDPRGSYPQIYNDYMQISIIKDFDRVTYYYDMNRSFSNTNTFKTVNGIRLSVLNVVGPNLGNSCKAYVFIAKNDLTYAIQLCSKRELQTSLPSGDTAKLVENDKLIYGQILDQVLQSLRVYD